jgi:hypothetical protein
MELKIPELPSPNGGGSSVFSSSPDVVTIALTKHEALGLAQLIDFAVRARGLEVAEIGLVLHRKLQMAVQSKL